MYCRFGIDRAFVCACEDGDTHRCVLSGPAIVDSCAMGAFASKEEPEEKPDKVRASLERHVEQGFAPAAAVVVVKNGCVVTKFACGGGKGGRVCSLEKTVFQTASISKTFIAALCVQCAERKELSLDTDICQFVGGDGDGFTARNPYFPNVAITVRHLLQHKSSLTDDESALRVGEFRWPADKAAEASIPLQDYLKKRLADPRLWSSSKQPGSADYHYSNCGFAILGLVLERTTGKSVEMLARERIFLPLGMQTTSFFLAELKKVKQSDSGQQTKILHFAEPEGYGHYEVAEFPACQVRTTANDLLRWMMEVLEGFPLLFEDAHSKMILMPSNYENGCAWWGKDASYGKKGENVWSHGGFMEGIRTHIFVWPETKSGSFVLLNGEGDYTRIEEAMYAAAK